MVFSRFIWTVVAIVGVIVSTAVVLGLCLEKSGFPITRSVLVVLLVLETVFLIYYLIRIRRDLLRLIQALRHEDPTLQFSRDGKDPYFSAIHRGFNEIIRNFRLVRLDREAEHRFFEATVNHIQFGIIAFDRDGNVEMANDSFLDLFQMKKLVRVSDLEAVSPGLPGWLMQLSREEESLKKVSLDGKPYQLIFLASRFRIRDREVTLVSVRDISREIDRNELEAWQKLMRVLRHEILNSITPIRLLSSNLSQKKVPLSDHDFREMKTGLDTIHRRAGGLSNFLDAYSNLYRVPELQLRKVNAPELLNRICLIYRDQFEAEKIDCRIECEDQGLSIEMDERLIEQVLINLVKNAVEALHGSPGPFLTLSAKISGKEGILAVRDNGPGIAEDQLDHIFIPFYSTREKGSGVGLSFAQHIMRLHQGRIHVSSPPGKGSEFQLVFGTVFPGIVS
jgi:two-component system nitrogen regulation sensor histidine kinase NtrY